MHSLLRSGEFGDCSDRLESYTRSCSELFPLATTFKPALPPDKKSTNEPPLASNNVDNFLSTTTEQRLGI